MSVMQPPSSSPSSIAAWPVWLVTAVTCLWVAALVLAARGAHEAGGVTGAFPAVVYAMGHVLCHQRPERSFAWGGQAWPVCARCAGIYVGAALGAALAATRSRTRLPDAAVCRFWLAASVLPSVVTLVFEWASGEAPGHAWRAIAGGWMGGVAAVLVILFLREPLVRTAPTSRRA